MNDLPTLFDELTLSATKAISGARAAASDDDRRQGIADAVRALTRLWSEMNPDFDRSAYDEVSAMVEQHWPAIVAGRNGADDVSSEWPGGTAADPLIVDGDNGFMSELGPMCTRLAAEPLFGARELLHSNLLAWFIDAEPAVASVFAAWSRPEPGQQAAPTARERYSFDLIVQAADSAPLVVENKVFSKVDREQLERYTPTALKHLETEPVFVLLSLIDPQWPQPEAVFGGRAWRHRSYGELGAALELAADHLVADDGGYRQQVLSRYAATLLALDFIGHKVTSIGPKDTPDLPAAWSADLDRVRLTTGFAKLRSQRVAQILDSLGVADVVGDVSRSQPLLEQFWPVPDSAGDTIGWQLQGQQWRLAVRVGSEANGVGRDAKDRALRERYVEQRYGSFFNFERLEGPLVPKDHGGWRAFAPSFVYRYRRLNPEATISDVAALAKSASDAARPFT